MDDAQHTEAIELLHRVYSRGGVRDAATWRCAVAGAVGGCARQLAMSSSRAAGRARGTYGRSPIEYAAPVVNRCFFQRADQPDDFFGDKG